VLGKISGVVLRHRQMVKEAGSAALCDKAPTATVRGLLYSLVPDRRKTKCWREAHCARRRKRLFDGINTKASGLFLPKIVRKGADQARRRHWVHLRNGTPRRQRWHERFLKFEASRFGVRRVATRRTEDAGSPRVRAPKRIHSVRRRNMPQMYFVSPFRKPGARTQFSSHIRLVRLHLPVGQPPREGQSHSPRHLAGWRNSKGSQAPSARPASSKGPLVALSTHSNLLLRRWEQRPLQLLLHSLTLRLHHRCCPENKRFEEIRASTNVPLIFVISSSVPVSQVKLLHKVLSYRPRNVLARKSSGASRKPRLPLCAHFCVHAPSKSVAIEPKRNRQFAGQEIAVP